MSHRYHRVAELVFGRPLLVEPHQLKTVVDVLTPRLAAGPAGRDVDPDPDTLQSSIGLAKHNAALQRLATIVEAQPVEVADGMASYGVTPGGVAVIPVCGMLTHRFDWLNAWCGITSYDSIGLAVRTAAADGRVKGLLLDVDSGGGEAFGCFELGDLLAKVGREKPVWAVANGTMASAAYGTACGASRILAPRQSWVGSIGVVLVHMDSSKADDARGEAYTAIYSGACKVDGWAHAPLEEAARTRLQALVDGARTEFAAHVGNHRAAVGFDAAKAMATEAGLFADAGAVTAGLADAVLSFDDALAELESAVNKPAAAGTTSTTRAKSMGKNLNARGGAKRPAAGTRTPAGTRATQGSARRTKAETDMPPKDEDGTHCEGEDLDPEAEDEELDPNAEGEDLDPEDEGGDPDAEGEDLDEEDPPPAQASALDRRLSAISNMPEASGHSGPTLLRYARSNMPLADVRAVLGETARTGTPGASLLAARDGQPKPKVGPNASGGNREANPLLAVIERHGLGRSAK